MPSQAVHARALALALAFSCATLCAPTAHAASVGELVKTSKPSDWRPLDPANTLYMELPGGRVVIELAPEFAPENVANIKLMAAEHYYDGLVINRSQDNFVVQWGDPNENNPKSLGSAKAKVKGEFTVPMANDKQFVRQQDVDGYAPQIGHSRGFPVGRDPKTRSTWLAHCYGMVGVGRGNEADSGNGSELYVVTGIAPRHLDRNITVVGRVMSGMPLLSSLPRGTAPMGMYEKPEQYVPIKSVRLASEVPEAERSRLEVMRTEAPIYAAVVDAQRNRRTEWDRFSAHHVDLCNAPIPVREQPAL